MPGQTATTQSTHDPRLQEAIGLMMQFVERTGVISGRPTNRYLWTDAFAVCNLLGIARATGDERYLGLALRLIDQVHHTLGRHRADDARAGWISGLSEREGESHPTRGGLRIGKALRERRVGEPFDEQLEWDRDGQYFHYLTQWMHALDQASRATGQARFNLWARELAETAYNAFSCRTLGSGRPRMMWKMSTDLSRPLVTSMGQHDALEGFVACVELCATAAGAKSSYGPSLKMEQAGFAFMAEGMTESSGWVTVDPLGIGGLLVNACRLDQLTRCGRNPDAKLAHALLAAALEGLQRLAHHHDLRLPASERLAFRELGLDIGLQAVELIKSPELDASVEALGPYGRLVDEIEACWRSPLHQKTRSWLDHRDINEVMLATSLGPDGYLNLGAGAAASLSPGVSTSQTFRRP